MMLRRLTPGLIMAIALFGASASAKADQVTFSNVVALQNNGFTKIDLLTNPGVTIFGPRISFMVDVAGSLPPGTTNLLQITYAEDGFAPIVQTFLIPAFGSIPPPFTQLFTITSPGATYQGTMAALTISIISEYPALNADSNAVQGFVSHTYRFRVAQPVPEPTSLALLGTALLGLWSKVRRRGGRTRSGA